MRVYVHAWETPPSDVSPHQHHALHYKLHQDGFNGWLWDNCHAPTAPHLASQGMARAKFVQTANPVPFFFERFFFFRSSYSWEPFSRNFSLSFFFLLLSSPFI
jgi:hypothetical protein